MDGFNLPSGERTLLCADQRAEASPINAAAADLVIREWHDLTANKQRDLRSAIAGAVKMCGIPVESIIMVPDFFNERIMKRPAAAFGLRRERYANVLSGLRYVLRRLETHAPLRTPFTPVW